MIREIKNNPYVFFKVLSNKRNLSLRITISQNSLVSLSNTIKEKIKTQEKISTKHKKQSQ